MRYLLNTINRIKNKSIKINRASIRYNNSKHVGILYKYIDENKQKALNDFKNKIENNLEDMKIGTTPDTHTEPSSQ